VGGAIGAGIAIGIEVGQILRDRVDSPRKFRESVADGRKSEGCDAHHIVAAKDLRAEPSRVILSEAGIPVHDPRNGALLSRRGHQGLHTTAYHLMVRLRLRDAIPNVDFALARLQFELEAQYPCPQ
jgi:hypothetical protein